MNGSPIVSQEDVVRTTGLHTVRYKYDDRWNSTDIFYFDLYGNPIDKLTSPSNQHVHMEYYKQNQTKI